MWSAPDPTSTMMARPLPESPVGRGEPGGAGLPGQRAASVLVSNSLHAWERCTCQAGKSFAVVSAQPTASRSCGGVTCPLRGYLIVRRQMSFFRHLGFIQRKFQGNLAQCCVIFHFCRQMSRYIATFGLFSTGKCHFRCRDILAKGNLSGGYECRSLAKCQG